MSTYDKDAKEFFAADEWPHTLIPPTPWWRKVYCHLSGGHKWRKFLWGGINHPFDCDMCPKCLKMRGPLEPQRDVEVFPSTMIPY